jgi:hypothetical protein
LKVITLLQDCFQASDYIYISYNNKKIMLKIITLIFWIFTCVFNLYCGLLYVRLNQLGIVKTTKRVSLKILNEALRKENDLTYQKKLKKVKLFHCVYLMFFYASLCLIISQLTRQA